MAGNKFWGGDSSSSDSDSDSDSEEEEKPVAAAAAPRKMARWAEASSSEDEGVAQRRVVRSHTDKKNEQMLEGIKVMKNHMKIDDYASTITDYESLLRMLEKLRLQMEQDGGPPKAFIKAIGSLEDYVEKQHEEIQEKKQKGIKLPDNKNKAFNTLRAKVKKGNKPFADDLAQLHADPDAFQSDEEPEASDSASEASAEGERSSSSDSSSSSSSSDSSSSDSDSDSDSSSDTGSASSDSDSDSFDSSGKSDTSDGDGDEDLVRERKMLRWLITPEKLAERERKAELAKAKEAENKAKEKEKRDRKKEKGEDGRSTATGRERKGKDEPEEYTSKELTNKVTEITQQRGRKAFDRKAYMDKLQKLLVHAAKHGPLEQLYIYASMVSADFDNTGSAFAAMKIEMWNEALTKVNKMLPLLVESHNNIKNGTADEKSAEQNTDVEDPKSHTRLQELYLAYVEKLDDELYKALQFNSDVYGSEYHEILANSSKCLVLLNRTLRFYETVGQPQPLGEVASRLMEQLYYKPDSLNARVYEAVPHTMSDEKKEDWIWPDDSKAYMGKLCHYVWATGDQRLRRRACLCQAYHLALHDCFQPARDLLHLGNFQEQAAESDVHTQILYNRVIAQIGLSAFRLGKITEAHNCLMDVCQYNKGRELLAQGLSYAKNMERSAEQEKAERQRQLPYHMHINLEVLESAQHICAMLLEVPNMAMQAIDPSNKRIISKVLRRALETYDKQQYTGPPETAKDSVVAAAKDLQRGDWAKACAQLEGLQLWHHIDTNHPENGEKVKAMITEKMKVEALRTYLFSYASIYDAFHLDQLVEMFNLDGRQVHSTISKMMIKEEITAFWDESSKYVLVQHVEPTPLQRLAITLAERAVQAVENNERLVDLKTGGFAFKDAGRSQPGLNTDSGKGGKGRMGKGFDMKADQKGAKGKGRGKGSSFGGQPVRRAGGWENARAGALRGGTGQRGWSTGIRA
ncbi:eIF3c [Symbiodinium natans]|uniref:Eukaryotic translation initiation factor 3 subunit C n=1 Tax=Symbiodinium natans TaxID=878477 RepID=A0A812PFZ6_9DINO|nr:eIF3c [Symbiodinium natans]